MSVTTIEMAEQDVAAEALKLQKQINEITALLEVKKTELRKIANGSKFEIIVEGVGKINVSSPSMGSESTVLTLDIDRLKSVPELRQKLLDKGIIREEIKKSSPSTARVTIKPNV
jgi:hypothetical protein